MKNKILSAFAAIAIAATTLTPVFAESPYSSSSNNGASASGTTVTAGNTEITYVSEVSLSQIGEPAIAVTPVSQTENLETQQLRENATKATSTGQLMDDYGVLDDFLLKAEAAVGMKVSADKFVSVSVFDVTANDLAKQAIDAAGGVTLTFKVDGISTSDKYVALHIRSTDGKAEALPVTVNADGTISITFTSLSPVMILKYDESRTVTSKYAIPNTGDSSNMMLYAGIAIAAVAVAGVAMFFRKKNAVEE